jgi:hypothetical protein
VGALGGKMHNEGCGGCLLIALIAGAVLWLSGGLGEMVEGVADYLSNAIAWIFGLYIGGYILITLFGFVMIAIVIRLFRR